MRQKKNFFTKNNSLNKGTHVSDDKTLEANIRSGLPKTDMLAEYEALSPGTASKLIEMARKEQEHEHKMEELRLHMQCRAKRLGRICGLFAILAICFYTSTLANAGHLIYAIIFAFISFGAILMLCCKSKCSSNNGTCNTNNNNRRNYHKPFSRPEEKSSDESAALSSDKDNKYRGSNRNYHNRRRKPQ